MQSFDIKDLTYQIKDFPFILDPENHEMVEEQFSSMGYVTVPTIGRYGGGGYELQNPLFVLLLPCQIKQGKCYYREQQINVPEPVVSKLINIQQLIKHNRPPKKNKLTKQQQEENSHAPEYNPQTFLPRNHFTLRFIISASSCKKSQEFMNYVCHNYIFRHQNFQNTKRHVALIPTCLIPGNDSGVYEWNKDYKNICWGDLRSQYISFHMKKGCPAFSPNNMKIGIQKDKRVLNFYTVVLTQLEYCVNYHWHYLDDSDIPIAEVIKSTKSIRELINFYKAFKGTDGAVEELQRLLRK